MKKFDSNKFNHKNKIGEFKYIDIKDLVNNIKNNTISVIDAKKELKTLIKIKNAELKKYRIRTSTQKELLNLFNDFLDTILTDNVNVNENVNKNVNDNDNDNENVNDNDNENENDNDNCNGNGNDYDNDDYIDNYKKNVNDWLDTIIDKTKSFEDEIKLLKK